MHARNASTVHPSDTDTQLVAAGPAPTFDLSIRQLLASAAAAVTAAILGSRLGVAGTLIGAALASSTTMIASAVYSHSLAAAQYRVRQARVAENLGDAGHQVDPDAPTTVIPAVHQAWGLVSPSAVPDRAPVSRVLPAPAPARRLPRWAMAGLGTLAACALALVTITGIEAVRGTPLSGGTTGGLSVLGGHSTGVADSTSTHDEPTVPSSTPITADPIADPSSDGSSALTTTDPATSTVTVTATESGSPSSPDTSSPVTSTTTSDSAPASSAASSTAASTSADTPATTGNPLP